MIEDCDQAILTILKTWPTIWSTSTAPWRSRTVWWTSTMVSPSAPVEKAVGSTRGSTVAHCRVQQPARPHGRKRALLHAIGPRDIGVQCREHGLDVPGIEALIDLLEKFHVDGHRKSP